MRLGEEENEVGQAVPTVPPQILQWSLSRAKRVALTLFRLAFQSFTRRFSAFSRRLRRRRISFSRSRCMLIHLLSAL